MPDTPPCPMLAQQHPHDAHEWDDGEKLCPGYGEPEFDVEVDVLPVRPCYVEGLGSPHDAHDREDGICPGAPQPTAKVWDGIDWASLPSNMEIVAAKLPPPTITIQGDRGHPLVTIHPNGTLEFGEDYDPDDAAQRFWDALRTHMPTRCTNCGHVPEDPS